MFSVPYFTDIAPQIDLFGFYSFLYITTSFCAMIVILRHTEGKARRICYAKSWGAVALHQAVFRCDLIKEVVYLIDV